MLIAISSYRPNALPIEVLASENLYELRASRMLTLNVGRAKELPAAETCSLYVGRSVELQVSSMALPVFSTQRPRALEVILTDTLSVVSTRTGTPINVGQYEVVEQ